MNRNAIIGEQPLRKNPQPANSQREAELAAEVAKLKRQLADQAEDLAILKIPKGHTEAATYFAKNQK